MREQSCDEIHLLTWKWNLTLIFWLTSRSLLAKDKSLKAMEQDGYRAWMNTTDVIFTAINTQGIFVVNVFALGHNQMFTTIK